MTLRRPNKVIIGPYKYSIMWSPSSWNKHVPKGKKWREAAGICSAYHSHILINPSRNNPRQQKDTLIHEIIHAVYRSYGLESLKLKPNDENTAEESIVTVTTPIIFQLLQDNKELFKWLLSDD